MTKKQQLFKLPFLPLFHCGAKIDSAKNRNRKNSQQWSSTNWRGAGRRPRSKSRPTMSSPQIAKVAHPWRSAAQVAQAAPAPSWVRRTTVTCAPRRASCWGRFCTQTPQRTAGTLTGLTQVGRDRKINFFSGWKISQDTCFAGWLICHGYMTSTCMIKNPEERKCGTFSLEFGIRAFLFTTGCTCGRDAHVEEEEKSFLPKNPINMTFSALA